MAHMVLLILCSLVTFNIAARGDDRAPHGLANENPIAFSPSAYEFFHPRAQQPSPRNLCDTAGCAPLPLAAQVESTEAHESRASAAKSTSGGRVGDGEIAGLVFGFTFFVLLTMGAYYVVATRRDNMIRKNSVQPDVEHGQSYPSKHGQ